MPEHCDQRTRPGGPHRDGPCDICSTDAATCCAHCFEEQPVADCDDRDADGRHTHGNCDLCGTGARACCRHCTKQQLAARQG